MSASIAFAKLAAVMLLALTLFSGCESTDGGGGVSGGVYYGVGIYDPWYYGGYWYDDPDIIVTPPDRPERPERPQPPIARPTPRPLPSIPTASRPMARPAMRR